MKLIVTILLAILATYLPGCTKYTPQKAVADATKAATAHPEPVLQYFRGQWPCITTGTTTKTDSTEYLKYREQLAAIDSFYQSLLNNIEPEVIHDTTRLTDSARCNELKAAYRRNEAKWQEKVKVLYSRISVLSEAVENMPAIKELQERQKEDSSKLYEARLREQRLTDSLKAAGNLQKGTDAKLAKAEKQNTWLWIVIVVCALIITRKLWWRLLVAKFRPSAI